jgi:hypothetical protein
LDNREVEDTQTRSGGACWGKSSEDEL